MLVERMQRGESQRGKSGKIIHQGYPPFGYNRSGKGHKAQYITNQKQALVIQDILKWYLLGNNGSGPM